MKKRENKSDALLNAYYKAVSNGNKHEARILLDDYAKRIVKKRTNNEFSFAFSISAVIIGVVAILIYI